MTTERERWKVGNEFLPYHPQASHVRPEYRDGWNACYRAALAQPAQPVAWQPCDRTLRVLARAFRKVAPHLIDEFINRAQEALLQEQDDDNQGNGGRTRGMAGKGDADHAGPAGQRNDEQHDDGAAERGAGLLRSLAHEDCGGGNAARVTEEGAVDAAPRPNPAEDNWRDDALARDEPNEKLAKWLKSTDGGDPREVAGPLAEQAGSLTPPERDNGRGPSSTPPSTLSAPELSDAECDAIVRRHWPRTKLNAGIRGMIRDAFRAGRATVAEVPREPTREMLSACDDMADDKYVARGRAYDAWTRMYDAARRKP